MKRGPVLRRVPPLPRTVIIRRRSGLVQAFGVFIDTIVICSCTAMLMFLVPEDLIAGLQGMDLLQTAMNYHMGSFGVVFIAAISGAVQLFHVPRNSVLCPVKCGLSLRR